MKEHCKEPSQSGVLIVGVGASRGLGAAIARRFATGGHPVTIAGRLQPRRRARHPVDARQGPTR
jgi:NAD(P)-dependent dehydrogenase (short-subunit alcohol dehydrogenase family)